MKKYSYILGIIFCQIVLLLDSLHVGADAGLTDYVGVHAFMESMQNPQSANQKFILAPGEIRNAEFLMKYLSWLGVITSLVVIYLSISLAFRLRGMTPKSTS